MPWRSDFPINIRRRRLVKRAFFLMSFENSPRYDESHIFRAENVRVSEFYSQKWTDYPDIFSIDFICPGT